MRPVDVYTNLPKSENKTQPSGSILQLDFHVLQHDFQILQRDFSRSSNLLGKWWPCWLLYEYSKLEYTLKLGKEIRRGGHSPTGPIIRDPVLGKSLDFELKFEEMIGPIFCTRTPYKSSLCWG